LQFEPVFNTGCHLVNQYYNETTFQGECFFSPYKRNLEQLRIEKQYEMSLKKGCQRMLKCIPLDQKKTIIFWKGGFWQLLYFNDLFYKKSSFGFYTYNINAI
jgi:hypothetical protein